MRLNTIKDLLRAKPFRPFVIHMSDGRTFTISHPELIVLSPEQRAMLVSLDPDERGRFRRRDVLDTAHITGFTLDAARIVR